MIRKFKPEDVEAIMDLWLDVNIHAHSFVPQTFWEEMRDVVRDEYLPGSRTWVEVSSDGTVRGFVSLLDELIGALFVRRDCQSRGIGKTLVEHVAQEQSPLFVDVYRKNERARQFYRRCGFVEIARFVQEETGETVVKKEYAPGRDAG